MLNTYVILHVVKHVQIFRHYIKIYRSINLISTESRDLSTTITEYAIVFPVKSQILSFLGLRTQVGVNLGGTLSFACDLYMLLRDTRLLLKKTIRDFPMRRK